MIQCRRPSFSRGLSWCLGLLSAGLWFTSNPAWALGFRIPNQDAEAIGRGNAFAATADNPAALYYNPAGITQLEGHHFQAGSLFYLGVTSEFRATDGSGRHAETEYEVLPVPSAYYTYSPTNAWYALGLGFYSPFGLSLRWPDNTGFRTLASRGDLLYSTVNPVGAIKLPGHLSLALGPTFNYSKLSLKNGIGKVPGDELRFHGDDWDYGFNAGLLWQPLPKWSFGANYRSATTLNYRGRSEECPFTPPVRTSAEVNFPQIVSGGVSFRPTPKWNVEVDVDWTDWSTLQAITMQGALNPLTGRDIVFPLEWHSSWFYHLGASRYFKNGYFLSAGYFFSENSTSEKFFNPIVPDTDLHVGSVGGGYKGKHWDWAVAGQIITGPWRDIHTTQTTSLVGESANGRYRFFVPAITVSLGYHF
jgi:long-chain fatty acid transport protein